MSAYLSDLRSQPARAGKRVMAPGDREWEIERSRSVHGIPIPQPLEKDFNLLAAELAIPPIKIALSQSGVKP